jgi:hypothetical protein
MRHADDRRVGNIRRYGTQDGDTEKYLIHGTANEQIVAGNH